MIIIVTLINFMRNETIGTYLFFHQPLMVNKKCNLRPVMHKHDNAFVVISIDTTCHM